MISVRTVDFVDFVLFSCGLPVSPSSSHRGRKQFFQEVGMGKSLVFLLSAAFQASVVEKSLL
jgi:hypothetical protein